MNYYESRSSDKLIQDISWTVGCSPKYHN